MTGVRPCHPEDIPAIAALHNRVWHNNGSEAPEVPVAHFERVFFGHPFADPECRSLVYEDDAGRVVGCLGAMPRRMSMNGRAVRVAIAHNLVVDPSSRSTLAAVHLLRTFFAGSQDLSVAEGNDPSRRVWEGLGGVTALAYGMRWTRPLRLAGYAVAIVEPPATIALLMRPLGRVADAMLARLPWNPFPVAPPATSGETLTTDMMLDGLEECCASLTLRPEYDDRSLTWLLDLLAHMKGRGTLRGVMVRGAGGDRLGWYLYYAIRTGVGAVVQIAARERFLGAVLEHLFHDAWRQGVAAVSGQLEPRFTRELSARHCLFRDSGASMLVYARAPKLLAAIQAGEAFFSRLDGEWCLNFDGDGDEVAADIYVRAT